MTEIRLGTIGSGFIVHNILDAVAKVEGIRCAAVYSRTKEKGQPLAEKYGVENDQVSEAIYNHTSGKVEMCDYTKVLFIADKIEVGRPQSTKKYRKALFKLSLNEMTYAIVKENYDYLLNNGWEIYPQTLAILENLKQTEGKK